MRTSSTASAIDNDRTQPPRRVTATKTGFVSIAPSLLGKPSGLHTTLVWLFGVAALITVILVVMHFGSLEKLSQLVHAARPEWLIGALFAQSATYLCAALVWHQALARAGHPLLLRTLVPIGIAKVFADQVLPSGGISGTMLVVHSLIRRAVLPEVALAAMLVGLVSYDAAYLVVVLVSAGLLGLHHRMSLALELGVSAFVIITIAVPLAVLALKRWGKRLGELKPFAWLSQCLGVTVLLRQLSEAPASLLRNTMLLFQTVALQGGIFLLDALTLWLAFRAIGQVPMPWIVFVSFAIASMVATIGPIPVGLGTFEATSVGMLHLLGVPVEAALAATLLLRGMTFWLPMIPGIWLARRELSWS